MPILLQEDPTTWEQAKGILDWIIGGMAILGGSGGLAYWYDRFRNRPQIVIRRFRPSKTSVRRRVQFEVENLGTSPTSLLDRIRLSGMRKDGDRVRDSLLLDRQSERRLPPREPKQIGARTSESEKWQDAIPFLRYDIRVSRGRGVTVRHVPWIRDESVSAAQYYLEMTLFKLWRRGHDWVVDRRRKRYEDGE